MYVIVVFGGTVSPLYSHHMYVIVVFGSTVSSLYSHHMYVIVAGPPNTTITYIWCE
jgi:hypothetical protein